MKNIAYICIEQGSPPAAAGPGSKGNTCANQGLFP